MIQVDMEQASNENGASLANAFSGLHPDSSIRLNRSSALDHLNSVVSLQHNTPLSVPLDTCTGLRVENLSKAYKTGKSDLVLFEGLSFEVARGEMLAVTGQSGAGKSTLLHLLGALDTPTQGDIYFASQHLGSLRAVAAARFRNQQVGYVWQFHYLLPEFTALENVALPLLARGEKKKTSFLQAAEWLERVDLKLRLDHRAGELSGGEQQRVALARALVTRPSLLLADEPTGDLDGDTAEAVFQLLETLHREENLTSILVTHNLDLASRCSRRLHLKRGRLEASVA